MTKFLEGFVKGFYSTFTTLIDNTVKMFGASDWTLAGILAGRMAGVLVVIFILFAVMYIILSAVKSRQEAVAWRVGPGSNRPEKEG